tara:strand:- start:311 stop:625 length:315 start_codon:yes stop_codon:yes gene_type:complete
MVVVVVVDGTAAPTDGMELDQVEAVAVGSLLMYLVVHQGHMVIMVVLLQDLPPHMVPVEVVVLVVLVVMEVLVPRPVLVMVEQDFRHQQHLEIQHHYHRLDLVV